MTAISAAAISQRSADARTHPHPPFDAQHAVDRFAVLLRDELNLAAIESTTVRAVADVVPPEGTTLWVRDRPRRPGSSDPASTPISA